MDRSEVKAIVDRELTPLCRRLGIDHWTIKYRVEARPADGDAGTLAKGECTRLVDYDDAFVTLNAEAFDDEAQVMKTLRHELFHIVLAPFDIFWQAVEQAVDAERWKILDCIWKHAVEQAVICLERMHYGLTQTTPADPDPQPKDPTPCP